MVLWRTRPWWWSCQCINYIHKRLNSFDKNSKFTVDTFPGGKIHFLDIKVDKNHTDIYYKDTLQDKASIAKHPGI